MQNILLVEDEKRLRQNIRFLLESRNYNVIEAEDGQEALDFLNNQNFDLIISDIMMQKVNGYELLNKLKSDRDFVTPFIFLTAKADISDLRNGMNSGADDYLMKPFRANDLLKAVEVRLEKRKRIEKKSQVMLNNICKYVPHELRTPLVSILGFTQVIMDEHQSLSAEEINNMIERIQIGSRRLHNTIEKFISYSELECISQDSTFNKRVIEETTDKIKNIILETSKRKLAEYNRNEDLVYDISDGAVKIPEVYLVTILNELLDNACKFSLPGSEIKITGKNKDKKYHLIISDCGIGMSLHQVSQIDALMQFNRDEFHQNGNGLGLITVKRIIEICKGEILIDSKMEKSTRIIIKLKNVEE